MDADIVKSTQEQLCEIMALRSASAARVLSRRLAGRRASKLLRAALADPALMLRMCHLAGFAASHRLGASSRTHTRDFREVFPELLRLGEPVICRCGGYETSAARTVECFSSSLGRWEGLPPMAIGRIACATAALWDNLYVFGGCSAGMEDLASAECFDPRVGYWRMLPPMPAARRLCTAATLGGRLYVLGRSTSSDAKPMALCYRPELSKWEAMPQMFSAGLPCAAVACEGWLYVFSCASEAKTPFTATAEMFHPQKAGNTAERYHPQTAKWEVLPPIPTPRRSFAAAAVSGKLYVCGGMSQFLGGPTPLAVVERLDPDRGIWEELPPMRIARGACTAASVYGMLYVFGGSCDDVVPMATVERFDPETFTWENMPQMNHASLLCSASPASGELRKWITCRL
eukprot:TRINITY_DN41291_c0_g1_i2.p1 TRINITY_DN41291_c0_g1~~TRINITY_DN41291_c0_g1_i2.p1  ORF type:complete len:469 (+),score=63.10 TRINITY_DN41291_c0_g1_i2:202-1407(+)